MYLVLFFNMKILEMIAFFLNTEKNILVQASHKNWIVPFFFFLFLNLSAQDIYTFERRMKAVGVSATNTLTYTDILPQSMPNRQDILKIELSNNAAKFFIKKNKKYVQFSKDDFDKNEEISIKTTVKLYRNDLFHAKKRQQKPLEEKHLSTYLKKEKHLDWLEKIADTITGQKEEVLVKYIFDYVIKKLDYDNFTSENQGVKQALERGRGDCTEYAELMVGLCRAKGLPARIVWGVIAKNSKNARHNWVEVYFKKYGWVTFDPTHADCEDCPTTFEKMENYYIYYSYERKDELSGWKGKGRVKSSNISYRFTGENVLEKKLVEVGRDYQQKKYNKAMVKLDILVQQGEDNFQVYNYRANIFLKQKAFNKALEALQLAMKYAYFDAEKRAVIYTFLLYYGKISR